VCRTGILRIGIWADNNDEGFFLENQLLYSKQNAKKCKR
jgi:hypothetical protein